MLTPPLRNAFAITPSDATDFTNPILAFYVGGAGNVAVVTVGGHVVTLTACIVGTVYYIRCKRINATNTTATLLVGLW